MKHIPRETNNIICMSLIRGIHRSKLVGHGSLWLQVSDHTALLLASLSRVVLSQDSLVFWSDKAHGGVKAETRQVFLFDHRIFVTLPANSDGFFDYQMDIKVGLAIIGYVKQLQCTISDSWWYFARTNQVQTFAVFLHNYQPVTLLISGMAVDVKACTKRHFHRHPQQLRRRNGCQLSILFWPLKARWWKVCIYCRNFLWPGSSANSALSPALVFGKPATPNVRQPSISVDWEGSDSSVDSLHSSPHSSTGDPDWPTSPGYEVITTS